MPRASTFVGVLCALLVLVSTSATAQQADPRPEHWKTIEDYYLGHPELKEVKSSGWKPFERIRWNLERSGGRFGTAEEVLTAWQEKLDREARQRATASWFQLGPINLSGRITTIEFHPTNPDIVYIGSASGGLWKTTDGGDTYSSTTDQLPTLLIGAVAVLDQDPNVVLIGTGEGAGGERGLGVFKSTDAGQTWAPTSLTYVADDFHGFHHMDVNPTTGTILAGAVDGLWRSTDAGDTWSRVISDGHVYDIQRKPGDDARIYAARGLTGGSRGVKLSTDDGLTWATVGSGQPSSSSIGKTKIAVTPADPNLIFAHYANSSNHSTLGIYASTDNGATWTSRNTSTNIASGQGWYNLTIAVDPDNVNRVMAGGVQHFESDDGGVTFSPVATGDGGGGPNELHVDHHALVYEPGSTTNVWAGNDGGVWKSTDDGNTWFSRREGLPTFQFYDICVSQSNPNFMTAGSQDNGFPGKDAGPNEWFRDNLGADGMVCNIHPLNQKIFAEWQFGNHVKSNDNAQSWFSIMLGISGGGRWVAPQDESQLNGSILFTETSNGIFRSLNGGNFWENISSHRAKWISISHVDDNVVWTVDSSADGVQLSTDQGATWTMAAPFGMPTGSATKIQAHPTDVSTAFVTFGTYDGHATLARTTDSGLTWTNHTGDLPSIPVNTMIVSPFDPTQWFVGTTLGVWSSSNEGVNWTPHETGFPNVVVTDLEIQKSTRKLVAGTYGRGAWEIPLPSATDVAIGAPNSSLDLMLDAPYPNPVSNSTSFRFAARHDGPVTLDVYDVTGRLVSRVAELSRGDGVIRSAPWFSDDVSSGIYFVVLAAGGEKKTVKMTVTR